MAGGTDGVVHGAPYRFADPARFAATRERWAPFPVSRLYDEPIRVLKFAVHAARLGREEELGALRRLDQQARLLERRRRAEPSDGAVPPYQKFESISLLL